MKGRLIKAFDNYGITELVGPGVSFECGERNGLHINEDHFLVEVIDPKTAETPYPLALVDLEEGPRLLARIDAAPDAVEIGAAVEATFHDRGDWTILHFGPARDGS